MQSVFLPLRSIATTGFSLTQKEERSPKGKVTEYNDQLSDHRLSKPLNTEIKLFEERISID